MTATTAPSAPAPLCEFRTVFELPPGWKPVPEHLRSTTPAPCDRCSRLARLPFGPGDALCERCEIAELSDRYRSRHAVAR